MELTDLDNKARECKSAEELIAFAKENGIDITEEQANGYLARNEGELSENELENVSGGAGLGCERGKAYEKVYFAREEDVEFIFKRGDIVEAYTSLFPGTRTATCKVVDLHTEKQKAGWVDLYWLEKVSGSRTPFQKGNYCRDEIQK